MKIIQTIVIMSAILSLAGGLGMQSAYAGAGTQTPLGASVTIVGACEVVVVSPLAFGSVDPVVNSFDDGGASITKGTPISTDGFKVTLTNSGNQASNILVDGTNWDDGVGATPLEVMSAGKTKFSDTAGLIASKAALPNNETTPAETPAALIVIEPGTPDFGTEDTFWDLDVTLDLSVTFVSGALSQVITLDFACQAPTIP